MPLGTIFLRGRELLDSQTVGGKYISPLTNSPHKLEGKQKMPRAKRQMELVLSEPTVISM